MQEDITKRLNEITQAINIHSQQIIGLTVVNQILVEILFETNPKFKKTTEDAISQIVSRPELLPNDYAKELLSHLLKAAQNQTRLTPEGRRSWLHPVK